MADRFNVTLLAGNAALTTPSAAGVTELASARLRTKVDISRVAECRVIATVSEAGSTNLKLRVQRSHDETNWSDLSVNGPDVPLNGTGLKVGAWSNIHWGLPDSGGRAYELFIRPVTLDGDGANTADVGSIIVEFR